MQVGDRGTALDAIASTRRRKIRLSVEAAFGRRYSLLAGGRCFGTATILESFAIEFVLQSLRFG